MRKCRCAKKDKYMYYPGARREPDEITYNYNYWYVIPDWNMAMPGFGPAGYINPMGYDEPFGGAAEPAAYPPAVWGQGYYDWSYPEP